MDNWVELTSFFNTTDADLLKTFLENEGIECQLSDEYTTMANPFITLFSGGVKLEVKEQNLVEALELLENKK